MMDIQAAVSSKAGSELEIRSVKLDDIKEDEVLVKITACAVSPEDLKQINTVGVQSLFPVIPGHEAIGEVIQTGSAVRSLSIGDAVVPLVLPQCNRCEVCLSDKSNLCQANHETQIKGLMPDGTSRLHLGDTPVKTCHGISAFATHIVIPEISLAKIPTALSAPELAILCGSMVSGLGAVFNQADLVGGENITIFGAGPVGLGAIQAARMRQVNNIIVVEPSLAKRELAKTLGANVTIDPEAAGEYLVATIQELNRGSVDFAFECSGARSAINHAVASTHQGWGKTILLSKESLSDQNSLDLSLIASGRQITGSLYGGVQGRSEMADYVRLYQEGHIVVKPLLTHKATLHEVNECLDLAKQADTVRSVIEF